ncbi:uncharacterized protein LOC136064401 [Quercus suber]|uniref:uncharacterized protein LOC136064401 n=1 Tax=Quercus suber TaxID=58331 RepID=UPI0032DF6F43
MRFNGSATITSNGLGIVLSCEDGDTMSLSFKLEFPCSNNVAEYEAYLIGLAIALNIRLKHIKVLEDSNLVVSQVSKQEHSIIGILKRMFPEEAEQKDWRNELKGKIGKLGHEGSIKSPLKTVTRFSSFSLIYGTEAISPMELVIPTPKVVLEEIQKGIDGSNIERRLVDLEGLEEEREAVRRRSQRYHQRMAKAYGQILHPRVFIEGRMVLRAMEHVRKNISGPSKFAPKWEGPYIIREAHGSGYY